MTSHGDHEWVFEPSAMEHAEGRWSEDQQRRALGTFSRVGFLQMNAVVPRQLTERLQRAYQGRYRAQTAQELSASSASVGDRRYMITVEMEPPFDSPDLYANPFVFSLLRSLLGPRVVLFSFGMVVALAGSKDQKVHRDHGPLFPEVAVGGLLPCYAAMLMVPLMDLDPTGVGTTVFWPGSHREAKSDFTPSIESGVQPRPTVGSVYLMDYRLVHAGTANRSDTPRPILYLIYSRPWFTDAENYGRQAKISISPGRLSSVPETYQSLFANVRAVT